MDTDYLFGPRVLDDGRAVWVMPLTFGRARIVTGAPDALVYDDSW